MNVTTATLTTLPCAKLLGLHDLLTAHTAYEAAIRDALNGRGPDLTSAQRGHAHEVGVEVAAWRAVCRWDGRRERRMDRTR